VGLPNGQACGSYTTLRFNSNVLCSVIFFRPPGHYVRDITLFNQNISYVYHIVAMRVI
jgi:hypothetical protein